MPPSPSSHRVPPVSGSTSASWINLAERWFATLTEKQIRTSTHHRSTRDREQAIRAYVQHNNDLPKPLVWTKTADEILARVARFFHHTSEHQLSDALSHE